ncbi:TPR repeat-containing serine/threonine protein kinase [Hyella patelloides LEGE 07179]|uniref:non-specific serine/threonine protein kinase n=1 Tax=Hyella patelloides LEGE 07179 TaxID=945734 RepID=A0A563VQD0_9CYAN|nr:serine/threonine-protein kinase [Hyella patelloides]VEP13589.1 TPR repeat-containing serine/threonine protein kinase [Hyella patelloides LEGE 07179]
MNQNLIGKTIRNRYHIIEQIGRGGSGVTFIAEDRQCFNDLCVVKKLQPQSNNPQALDVARRLFDTEADILGQLGNHDHIPRLLAYFEENQEFFIVQELIKGRDFSDEIAEKPYFSQEAIVDFLEDVLETLVFVQEYGVIHRDIKPSNLIRRSSDSKIVLIDFGSVKQVSLHNNQQKPLNKPTVIVGTENYIPIEQVMGNPGLYSDIYALGIVAVEALTGKLPCDLPVDRQGELIWHDKLQDKSQYSPQLLKAIDKAICHYHKQRYQTAKDFLEDVRALKNKALLKSSYKIKYFTVVNLFKKNIIKAILFFILTITTLGIVFVVWQPKKMQYTNYANQDYGVKINYPENWEIRKRDDFFISGIIFISPLESRQDSFQENVSVFVENLVSDTSLNQYTAESIAEIKRLSDPNISDAKLTVLGSYEGRSIVYEGEEKGSVVKRMQIWTVHNSKAYTITYTAKPDSYETFLPTIKQMVASFDVF